MSRNFVVDLGAWSVKLAVAVPGLRGGIETPPFFRGVST